MKAGDVVTVLDFFENKILRIVVEFDDEYVYVCNPEEWESSKASKRQPDSIGFHRRFVEKKEKAA